MQGRRVYPDAEGHLHMRNGDYGKDGDGMWWVRPPRGDAGILPESQSEGWMITEHEDGTITVSPSINLEGIWHGFLERGVWRE